MNFKQNLVNDDKNFSKRLTTKYISTKLASISFENISIKSKAISI